MYFSRLYSNFPNLTRSDESLIRRAMVLAKLMLARNTECKGYSARKSVTLIDKY